MRGLGTTRGQRDVEPRSRRHEVRAKRELQPDGAFLQRTTLPKPGAYRLLADYYPAGGVPQLTPSTIATEGYTAALVPAGLKPDLAPQHGENLEAELTTDPPQPLAGKKTLLYVLFEHQSTVDPLMLFRLLAYMVRIWETHLQAEPEAKRLPVIIPVVLHHSHGGWTAKVAFEDLLDVDATVLAEIAPYVPHFRCVLDDLGGESEEALRARAMSALGRLALWCLKNSRTPELLVAQLGRWGELMRQVARAPDGMAAVGTIFGYMSKIDRTVGVEELQRLVAREIGKDVEEAIVTTADMLRAEGRTEGRTEGRNEAQRTVLLKLLSQRFGALPEDAVARVNAAEPAQLEEWFDRVLTGVSLAAVVGEG